MSILKYPIVTEKMSALSDEGKYGFVVERKATKVDVKKAVKEAYGVTVESVRTINVMGKRKTKYTKNGFVTGRRASYKKAIVKVAEGEVIDFYSGI